MNHDFFIVKKYGRAEIEHLIVGCGAQGRSSDLVFSISAGSFY